MSNKTRLRSGQSFPVCQGGGAARAICEVRKTGVDGMEALADHLSLEPDPGITLGVHVGRGPALSLACQLLQGGEAEQQLFYAHSSAKLHCYFVVSVGSHALYHDPISESGVADGVSGVQL